MRSIGIGELIAESASRLSKSPFWDGIFVSISGEKILNPAELCTEPDVDSGSVKDQEDFMRGVLLWLVGIPIPIIILLFLFNVV
jgi:hypothetical protein